MTYNRRTERQDGATGAPGTILTRLERACLQYLRDRGEAPSVERSTIEGGLVVLRNAVGQTIAELLDGFHVAVGNTESIGMAHIRPFVIRVRCFRCDRSTVRDAAHWVSGEVWECRCGARCVLPGDPIAATKHD